MTCLSLIQSAARRVGLPAPNAAVTSTDLQIQQLVDLANAVGRDLVARYDWNFCQNTYTFTTLATEIQIPNMVSVLLAPGGVNTAPAQDIGGIYIQNNTMWNQTLRRPVFGPLTPQQWQQQKAMFVQGPWNQYRIFGNALHFLPTPAAGQTVVFEYIYKGWVYPAVYANNFAIPLASVFLSDTDSCAFDEELITLGAVYRWKQAKGLAYAEDMANFERRVADAMSRDATKPILNMGESYGTILPGVWVPAGSW